jgi:hypothetical protein
MIKDDKNKAGFAEDWEGVQKLRDFERRVHIGLDGGAIDIGSFVPDAFWNLPLVLAFSVLDGVLTELREQREFSCKDWKLGAKMEASKRALPWQDYDLVFEGKEARNDLAHEAKIVPKQDCFKYIGAIEAELLAWSILPDPASQ